LPYKTAAKLLFPLCKKCVEELHENCTHSNEERMLTGTWCSLEVDYAIKQGYKLIEYYCVWHFEECYKYDPITKLGGLFATYVDTFLRGKTESTGWPDYIESESDSAKVHLKDNYISEFYDKEGVMLDKKLIIKNPGLRATCKTCLNSHWGKYCENNDKSFYAIVRSHTDLLQLYLDDRILIQKVILSDQCCQVYYKKDQELAEANSNTNCVIGAFVTAQARLKLLSELNKLGDRVLYYDTDSIIYIHIEGLYNPSLGNFLGDFTNELIDNEFIVEFASGGPKNYAYKTNTGKTKSVVKGISLTSDVVKIINFDSIKDLVLNDFRGFLTVNQFQIKRNKLDWSIKSSILEKSYRIVYNGRVLKGLDSIPYG
jgi:hypothetical protein